MATVNKNFRIKNGLVVEGNTATVNGNNVLTTASSIDALTDVNTSGVTANQVLTYIGGQWVPSSAGSLEVTDAYTNGNTIYVGTVTPTGMVEGDVWIDQSSVTGAITWGQLKALQGIGSL